MTWQPFVFGLVVGWLAELAIDYFFWRKRRICSEAEEELQETVEILRNEVNRLKKKCGDLENQETNETKEDEEEKEEEEEELDDLKRIWGIGPKIELLLNFAGITTFEKLAATDHMTLDKILEDAGKGYKVSKHSWSNPGMTRRGWPLTADGKN